MRQTPQGFQTRGVPSMQDSPVSEPPPTRRQPRSCDQIVDLNVEHSALEHEIAAARTFDEMEAAFAKIERLTANVLDQAYFGRKLYTRGLDGLVPYLAK